MSKEKKWAKHIYVREYKDPAGWSVLNLAFSVDKFCEYLQSLKNTKGYAHLVISQRKEETEKGLTHKVHEEEYKNAQ